MPIIIAEAGVNHNGDINTAKQLIDVAAKAGADFVKFQTFKTEKNICINAPKAEYQKHATDTDESQFEMVKKLELDKKTHIELKEHCEKRNIKFLSTPFDLESVDLLAEIGMEFWKIPSGEITNLPLLQKIGSLNQEIVMSTGMADLGEIEDAVEVLENSGTSREKIIILHCNTEYPTPIEDVNLNAMLTLSFAFKTRVGYSDHSLGIEVPIAATALGAEVIEKHFTLDKNMEGPDHKASLDPAELEKMVSGIRKIETAMGNGIKRCSLSEEKNKIIARKSIVALKFIKKGKIFGVENITVKRPATGISPMKWNQVLGKKAKKDFIPDELISL